MPVTFRPGRRAIVPRALSCAGGALACAWLLAPAGPAAAKVRIDETVAWYDIGGATPAELRRQMAARGPASGAGGGRAEAKLRAYFEWSFVYEDAPGACRIRSTATTVHIQYVLPRWAGRGRAHPEVRAWWDQTFAALKAHEDRHARYSKDAAARIDRGLAALPPNRSCDALRRQAHGLGQAEVRRNDAVNREFDRRTDHGRR